MTKIFLDCGFYAGNTIKRYFDEGIIDNSWLVYAFEPNPELEVEGYMVHLPVKVHMLKLAVWVHDGKVPFRIQGRHDAARISEEDSGGMVDSIDFSGFVARLPEDARIICSMDIEGAEFPVLEKMLDEGTINQIELLDIEFHHRLMLKETPADAQKLIDRIKERGVKVKLKVDLE